MDAYQELINHNLRFVISVAKKYQHCGMSLEDLVNEGNLGLIKAVERFDLTKGFKFISYAVWWIRQSILQAVSDKSRKIRLPANQQNQQMRIYQARDTFLQENEREPIPEELAEMVELSISIVNNALTNSGKCNSLDAPIKDGEDGSVNQFIIDDSFPDPDYRLAATESMRIEVQDMLDKLSDKEAKIMELFFGIGKDRGMSLQEIGDQFQINGERVRQIKDKALKKLRTMYYTRTAV
jgi:RNA polymerase primary sigma factor